MAAQKIPIEVSLIAEDEKVAVLYCVYTDPWTWRDFYQSLAQDDEIIRNAEGRRIYRVVDLTNTRFIPLSPVPHFRKAARHLMRAELTVFVTTNPLMRGMGKVMNRLFPRTIPRVRHVANLIEATELISRLSSDEFN